MDAPISILHYDSMHALLYPLMRLIRKIALKPILVNEKELILLNKENFIRISLNS